MVKYAISAVVVCATLALTGSVSHAQIAKSGQDCINNVNKSAMSVSKSQGKENAACVKNAVKGNEPDPSACLSADGKGKVAKKEAKTFSSDTKHCTAPPSFGYTSAAVANAAATGEGAAVATDLYGAGMNAALAIGAGDKDSGTCQSKISKHLEKVVAAQLKAFRTCKKDGLKSGVITTGASLADCFDNVSADGKAISALSKMDADFTKRCAPLPVASLFPGTCASAPDLPDCFYEITLCRTCRMLDLMDGTARDCDLFDNGAADASCETPPIVTTTTTTTLPDPTCGASNFLDLTGAAGPGVNDPISGLPLIPQVSATCDPDELIVTSNNIPHYTFTMLTPTDLDDVTTEVRVPRFPSLAADWTEIACLGTVGIAVNGVVWFGPNEAVIPDPYGDPVANAITDNCRGHHGSHHYHGLVTECLAQDHVGSAEPWNETPLPTDEESPIIAYAYDGFPIHGPYGCEDVGCTSVIEYKSGWENTSASVVGCASTADCSGTDVCTLTVVSGVETTACVPNTYAWDSHTYVSKVGTQYLDVCNGHTDAGGDYHYHTTSTFPYILGCFSGTPAAGAGTGTGPGVPSPCPTP